MTDGYVGGWRAEEGMIQRSSIENVLSEMVCKMREIYEIALHGCLSKLASSGIHAAAEMKGARTMS